MKHYIEFNEKYYKRSPASTLEYLFATLGNGVSLDNKGYLSGNYLCDEAYVFAEPEPLDYIYPWSNTEDFQPFRDLAGCRDVGFKEAAEWFIKCIELTPDTLDNISEWKENLHIVREVLLNTPTIEDPYTIDDLDKFIKEVEADTVDATKSPTKNSVYKTWFFDVTWTDCPESVKQEVTHLWTDEELGNDKYVSFKELDSELFDQYPRIYFWLKHKGVSEGERVVIHWWW